MKTRQTLLQKIKANHDDRSWEDFVYYYRAYVLMLIKGMGLDHHTAEDISQQVMIKTWKKLPDFDYNPKRCLFRTWLSRVVKNTVLDYLKSKAGRMNNASVELNDFEEIIQPDIEKLADQEWKTYITDLAWSNVRPHFKDNVIETFLELRKGGEINAIAGKMGIQENTVYVYRKRVENALAKEIVRLDKELS